MSFDAVLETAAPRRVRREIPHLGHPISVAGGEDSAHAGKLLDDLRIVAPKPPVITLGPQKIRVGLIQVSMDVRGDPARKVNAACGDRPVVMKPFSPVYHGLVSHETALLVSRVRSLAVFEAVPRPRLKDRNDGLAGGVGLPDVGLFTDRSD